MATIKDVAEILVKINDEEAKKQLPALQQKVKDLNKQFDELRNNNAPNDKIKEVGKELKKTYEQAEALRKRTQSIDEAMQNISLSTPKELKRLMAQINGELNSGAIERGTKEWDEYCDKLKQVKTELKKIAEQQKVVEDAGLSFKDMLDIGGNLSMITSSLLEVKDSVAEFMRDNVNSYIELDAEMANVQKFTGMSRRGVEELNEEFKKIDTRTSIVELNKLAEEAGRLGKTSKEDVLGFVKAADIINVALDDLGEGATLEISKLTDIFGDEKALGTERSMLAVGSVINELSQNCTAAAPYLTNFTKRLAGIGAQADMTIPQIMGFAAVLDSKGQAVEMSATAVSQLITKMFQDPAKIAKAVGLDIQEFTDMVKTDTNAALLTLLERLNSFGSMDILAPLFKEMGTDGARASAVLSALAGNIDMVREQQEIATQAYNEATSVVKEFTVQNETEEAKLEKKRKKLEEVKVALGEKLLPIMGAFTSTGTFLIKTLNALIDIFTEYKSTILLTGSAIVLYTGYIKIKNLWTEKEMTLEKAKILLQTKSLNLFNKLKVAMASNPWGLAIVALTTIVGLFSDYNRKLSKVTEGEKALANIRSEAREKYIEEEIRIKSLIKVAEDERASLERRQSAIDALNKVIPNYNAQLDATSGKYKANKLALDGYIASLARMYEVEGAKTKLAELGKEKADLAIEKKKYEDEIAGYRQKEKEASQTSTASHAYGTAGTTSSQTASIDYSKKIDRRKSKIADIDARLANIANAESTISEVYGKDLEEQFAKEIADNTNTTVTTPEIEPTTTTGKKDAVKDWLDRENAVNRTAYATGQIDYEEFLKKKHEILIDYYDKMLQNTSLSETERLGVLADKAEEELEWKKSQEEAEEKRTAESMESSLSAIDEKYKQAKAKETAWCYDISNENYGNEKILHEKLFQANVEYLKEKEQLYRSKGYSEEADKIAVEREKLVNDEKLRKQKEFYALYEKMHKEYQKASSEEQMAAELATLDALHKEGIIKEVEYQELRKAIQEKYSSKGQKFSDGGFGDMLSNLYTSWDTLISGTTDKTLTSMQKIGAVAQSTWAIAGAALQQYSAYSQACCDVEVAEIEAKYEKEIKAAGKNQKRVALLEEQKEKDIAKVKGKYNKKAMTIEMAQAVAQTAIAAINAYSSAAAVPVVGYILAPIAAAMAIAAGALQIETIKKQHQAQQAGYYHGGFTRRSANNREEVGVVHANEFVVNAAMTQDPRYKPLWSLIDYAQRNNAVPSLTPEDVSYSLGTGAVVRATTTSSNGNMQNSGEMLAVATSIGSSARAIDRLNRKLDEGIESFMVMDGERGFDRRYEEYKKMKNRPRR